MLHLLIKALTLLTILMWTPLQYYHHIQTPPQVIYLRFYPLPTLKGRVLSPQPSPSSMLSLLELLNQPKFDRNRNVNTFVRLFENSMLGAADAEKSSDMINFLDAASVELVIPYLPARHWTFKEIKDAIARNLVAPKQLPLRRWNFWVFL